MDIIIIIFLFIVCLLIWELDLKKSVFKKKQDENKSENKVPPDNQIVYKNLEEWKSDLFILWQGSPLRVEFTYDAGDKKRRELSLCRVLKNSRNELYFSGISLPENEEKTFRLFRITTMILYKSKRFYHGEFLNKILGIDCEEYLFRI